MEPLTTEQEYQQMRTMLNEKQWRQYLAAEAQRRGSASRVAREAGVSRNTVKRGLREREAGQTYRPGARIRKPGAGRKKLAERVLRRAAALAHLCWLHSSSSYE